jgi:hypothetical protein
MKCLQHHCHRLFIQVICPKPRLAGGECVTPAGTVDCITRQLPDVRFPQLEKGVTGVGNPVLKGAGTGENLVGQEIRHGVAHGGLRIPGAQGPEADRIALGRVNNLDREAVGADSIAQGHVQAPQGLA